MNTRDSITSAGEHLAAVLKLGDSYTVEEYLEAIDLARAKGAGALYADRVLGADADSVLRGVEEAGDDVVKAAERASAAAASTLPQRRTSSTPTHSVRHRRERNRHPTTRRQARSRLP